MDLIAGPPGFAFETMMVPGWSGLNVLRQRTVIPLRTAGPMVDGWRTLPP